MCGYLAQHHQLLRSELEKLRVVVPESSSSDTKSIPAFSFQHRFTVVSVTDTAEFVIHVCANQSLFTLFSILWDGDAAIL